MPTLNVSVSSTGSASLAASAAHKDLHLELSATEATFKDGLKKDGLKLRASKKDSFAFTYVPQGHELSFEFSASTSALELHRPATLRFVHKVDKKSTELDLGIVPTSSGSAILSFDCGKKKLNSAKIICTSIKKLALDAKYIVEKKSINVGATYAAQSDLKLRGTFDTGRKVVGIEATKTMSGGPLKFRAEVNTDGSKTVITVDKSFYLN